MTVSRYVLAVDLGTSGAKVALIGIDGRVAAWESEPVELIVLPGGGAEQRPEDWWRALVAATRRLLARHPGPAIDIAAAGLGGISFADVPGLVEYERFYDPQTAGREVYDERYRTLLEIHKRMRPLHRRIDKGAQ
jgi:sugar (pentulose or hexulose) kinase